MKRRTFLSATPMAALGVSPLNKIFNSKNQRHKSVHSGSFETGVKWAISSVEYKLVHEKSNQNSRKLKELTNTPRYTMPTVLNISTESVQESSQFKSGHTYEIETMVGVPSNAQNVSFELVSVQGSEEKPVLEFGYSADSVDKDVLEKKAHSSTVYIVNITVDVETKLGKSHIVVSNRQKKNGKLTDELVTKRQNEREETQDKKTELGSKKRKKRTVFDTAVEDKPVKTKLEPKKDGGLFKELK